MTKRELESLRSVLRASERLEDPNATPFLVEYCCGDTPSAARLESALAAMREKGGRLASIRIAELELPEAEEVVE